MLKGTLIIRLMVQRFRSQYVSKEYRSKYVMQD